MINIFTSIDPSNSIESGDVSGVSPFLTPRAIAIYLVIFATAILVLAINFMITESKKEKRIAKEESEARKAPFVRRDKHKEVIQIVTKFPENPSVAPIVAANPALMASLKNSGAQIPVSDVRALPNSDEMISSGENSENDDGKKDMHRFQKLSKIDTIYPALIN